MLQDIADTLGEGDCIDSIRIDFSNAFNLVPDDRLFTKLAASGVVSRVVVWVREFIVDRRKAIIQGSQINLTCASRESFGPTTVSSVRKWYLEEHRQ